MKKKKLKKKIKKLEEAFKLFMNSYGEALNNERNRISTLGEKYTKMREDINSVNRNRNTDLGLIKDACSKADKSQFQINDIYEKLKVLKLRTETDYTQFKPLVDTSKGPDDASRIYP